ncbi:protein ecdysoneless homolog [Typha latifolia]|uniref:protein ecdysoneless homolog n=1 Tax=Typha latifolia TaxID=4733 RepID=UPI003C2BE4C0
MEPPPSSSSSSSSSSTSTSFSSLPFPLRRHRVPDDTVFYAIYPDLLISTSPSSALSSLRSLHLHLNNLLSPYLSSYLFHRDPFHLSLPDSSSSRCPLCSSPALSHLHGKTHFGDSIADEWFIVSLLFAASREVPSISVRVWDSDGEFLLIEAAFSLPRWLNPETSQNRVFIRRGELHIVPKKLFPTNLPLESALEAIRSDEINTRAPDSVQAAINRRIAGYPEKARDNMHKVRVRVPTPVAQVLKVEPCLISLAVEGFYDRDVDSMKHAARMERFLRKDGGEIEMVRISVTMSRAMYGQLVQQNFQSPRCYPMPSRDEGPLAYAETELGMKIACGFEMMYQERRQAGGEGKDGAWEVFKQSLESSGCFNGLLPGSKEYQRIMEDALQYYRSTTLFSRTREILNAPICRIDEILSMPYSGTDFEGCELPQNDDDSWLYSGEDELNSAIQERQKEMEDYEAGKKHRKNLNQKVKDGGSSSLSNDFNLGNIAETMQEFVQKISSYEGAEVPGNRNSEAVELDADQFFKAVESVLGEVSHERTASDAELEGHTSSSDMDFDDSEEEEEGDFAEEHIDKEAEDSFMQSYTDALTKELSTTSLKRSFIRAQQSNDSEGQSTAAEDMDEELTPVDVDVNLVKSFLDSFSSQEGLPGPASNLLGLMGVKVPPDSK